MYHSRLQGLLDTGKAPEISDLSDSPATDSYSSTTDNDSDSEHEAPKAKRGRMFYEEISKILTTQTSSESDFEGFKPID